MRTILLDASPLGLLCGPFKEGLSEKCHLWLAGLVGRGYRVLIPEITDYEVRRELIRAEFTQSIEWLDDLQNYLEYLPLSTAAMRRAAELWADARQTGRPTAGDQSIDADAILAGQALALDEPDYVIATTNLGHLERYAAAATWGSITRF